MSLSALPGAGRPVLRPPADLSEAFGLVVGTLERQLQGSVVWIGHLDREHARLRVIAAGGERSYGIEPGMEAPIESSLCEVMAGGLGEELCGDTTESAAYRDLPPVTLCGLRSFVGAPLRLADGTAIGTVCAAHRETSVYSELDLGLLRAFAALLSGSLEQERRRGDLERVAEDMRRQAHTDALTGVANRRSLFDALDREIRLARHGRTDAALVVADLDGLKDINDRYGHGRGDDALVLFARALQLAAGPHDLVGRLGGDEFVAVLPDVGGGRPDTRGFVARVEEHLTAFGGVPVPLSACFGSVLLRDSTSPDAALEAADRQMYEGKRGRFRRGVRSPA